MGYHYFNQQLVADNAVDALEPEVIRGPNTNPPGVATAPSVLGMQMHILVPAVGFWLAHAWVWKNNPAGMFADWNPEVTCP